MRSRVVMTAYCVWMIALSAAFFLFPAGHLVLWSLLALSCSGALVAGAVVHRPPHPASWWLLALGVTLFAAGDTTYNVLTTILGEIDPFPSLADVFYLPMYPVLATALVLLVRHRTEGHDQGSVLDAASLTVAVGLLSWIYLVNPYIQDSTMGWLERAISVAYPLGDILLLATLVRLLVVAAGRTAALALAVGLGGLLVSDVLYGFGQLAGTWQIGGPEDLGWVVFYLAWGLAGLHPSMGRLTVPVRRPTGEMSVRGVAVLMAASLIAPGVLLADTLAGGTDDGVVIAVFSAVFFVLVLSRVGGVVARYGRTVERERALREVGAALLVAEDERQVVSAVCAAVDRLAASGPHRCEVLLSADAGAADGAPSRLVPAAELAAEAAVVARGYRTAVVCPLVVEERRDGGRPVGLLVVAADDPVLFTLRGALEVLAAQAALAIERLVLARAVSERDNEAYFRTLVHNSHDVVLIVDDGGRVRYASPSARSVLGPAPVQGLPVADLVDPQDREDTASPLVAVARGETPPEGAPVCRVLRRDGDRIEVQVAHRDLRDDPTVRGIVLTLRDVTEQRRLERELTHRASHDALTGLPNRVLFRERVDTAIGALPGRRAVVGVLLLDLDDFKLVNDTLGHTAGDELLIAIAGRLSSVLRVVDTPARLGGDEFAVLIEDADTEADVELVAERVVEALRIDASTGGPACSVSVGVAVAAAGRAHGSAELLRRADLALYAAKSAGKGQWRRYAPDLHLAAVDRVGVRTELKGALADGQFELRYQPVVELDSGVTAGLEALVRWHHPRRGTLAPGEFVRVAEETGLILPLGSWVLDRALSDIAAWRRLSPTAPMLHVGVNVSARQVRSPGFVGQVLDALARWGVPPGAVLLEITETALLADDVQVADDLADLRAHGVRIALDDFGTGYSSLDYLRVHPVDVVKIDRSFIDGMDRDPRQADLVAAMVELARAIGLEVIAEGVETAAQRAALLRAGCRLGQGFLYSAAIPADDVVDWLRTSSRAGALDGAGATPDAVAALAPPDHSRAP